jgi:ADP-ribose pyrophosphatase
VRVAPGGGEAGEGVRAHVVPLGKLETWLETMRARGFLVDPKVLAGAYLLSKEMDGQNDD